VITKAYLSRIPQIDRIPHATFRDLLVRISEETPLGWNDEVPLLSMDLGWGWRWWRFLANLGPLPNYVVREGVVDMLVTRRSRPSSHAGFYGGHRLVVARADGTKVHVWPGGGGDGPRKAFASEPE